MIKLNLSQDYSTFYELNSLIHYINKKKDKNNGIISIDAQKAFGKISHLFLIKILKFGIEATNHHL